MREVMRWDYKTKDGHVVGHVIRLEDETKHSGSKSRKAVIPHFKPNGQSGVPDDLDPKRRIYGLDSIQSYDEPIYVVEGEKCAYALHGLGYQAISSLGGSGQAHLADWSVLYKAKQIYLMPDYDAAGAAYMQSAYNGIRSAFINQEEVNPPTIKIIPFKLKPKADVCDFISAYKGMEGWDELSSLISHPLRSLIRKALDAYIADHAAHIPAAWKFLISAKKHKLITLNDFKEIKLPPRTMLLHPWLPEGSINMIFADRGIGKTFFSLSCALALANGGAFLGYQADEPISVLYLDGEMQATAIQKRLKALSGGKTTKAPLHLYTPDCQDNDFIPDIGTQAGRDEIDELIDIANPKVIFVDNLSTFDRTGNENEAESWAPIQAWAIKHRKYGRSIVFIHHANKEGKQRGSHKKEDVMDAVIRLKRPDDYIQGEGSTKIMIQYTKARHLSGEQAQDIEATLYQEDEHLKWEWEQGDILYRKAIDMLKNSVSMRDIAEELSLGKSTIHRWKSKAQSEGLL